MEGLYVASVVPFDDAGHINDDAIRILVEKNLEEGAAGFFVAGSSGECFLLTPEERLHLYEIFSEYKNRCTLFAHVGSCGTDESIRYARAACEMGYERIAATPPIYFGYTSKEVAGYYDELAESVGHGIYYYNIPMNTKRSLDLCDPETRALFSSGSISGIKHTNLDLYEMERIRSINPVLKCFGGFENEMVAFMAMGCDGFIGSTFNFMLPHFKRIYEAFLCGRLEEARELQVRANNIMESLLGEGLFSSIKFALQEAGIEVGGMRKPFVPLDEAARVRVRSVITANLAS
ncbi:dihydrodipicolinate synthase family protein [Olsenella phocaeensis]|uniref:dihydrodipicolinate synthase family protein n=1 Tax=Olsenella phocaeensis TaxID=1852385 RepID=UPI0009311A18|nr:dihydrodipicolinate synthase family protein [Olsenella phocaeensis]